MMSVSHGSGTKIFCLHKKKPRRCFLGLKIASEQEDSLAKQMLDADAVGLLLPHFLVQRNYSVVEGNKHCPVFWIMWEGWRFFPSHSFPFKLFRIEEIYLFSTAEPGGSHRPGNSKLQCVFSCFWRGVIQLLVWHYSWAGRSCPVPKEKAILVLFNKNRVRVMVLYPPGMRNPFHLKTSLCTLLGILFLWLMIVYYPFLFGFSPQGVILNTSKNLEP